MEMIAIEKQTRKYKIKTYESDYQNKLKISNLFNFFQDSAEANIDSKDIGYDFLMQHNVCWVAVDYHIKFSNYPMRNNEISITTWPSAQQSLLAIRDFLVTDENNNTCMVATSRWVMINMIKKRPVHFKKIIPNLPQIDERVLNSEFEKIELPERIDNSIEIIPRYDDFDVNKHVNNAVYPSWGLDSVPIEFREARNISEFEINFKSETKFDEKVIVDTQIDGNRTIHHIKEKETQRTIALLRISWKML